MIDGGNRVLPGQHLPGHEWSEVACNGAHVAMGELVPRPREGIGELLRMLEEATGDLFVGRIEAQGEVGGQHGRCAPLGRIVGIRNGAGAGAARWGPLMGTGRTLRQFPLVTEQILEKVVAPPGRRRGPSDLQPAANGVARFAAAESAVPAEPLGGDVGSLRLRSHQCRITGAMGLAEAVSSCDQRHGLFIIHRHAGERVADIPGRCDRIRPAVRAFRIHVDQTHLHGREGIAQAAVTAVAFVCQPLAFRAPENILFGLPHIRATTAEAESLESHRLQGDVAREDHEVGP